MSHEGRLAQVNYMTIMALSFVFCWVGGLGLFYGGAAWKAAAFPILFLLFMVPIPTILLDKVVHFLQAWSADVAYIFFGLTGVPLYRDGFLFHLPGLTIEVAKECSGIRSSISLFLVSLLAGHLMLRKNWRKGVLTLSIVPIAIVKNAVRIVTLSLLGVYVDPRILGSMAHRSGGIPIFLLALVLLGGVLWLLRRGEKKEIKAFS
jgi:exosortase